MNNSKMAGIVLVMAGVLGLAIGSFSYTRETHDTKIGPIELSVDEKETVNVPIWLGLASIVIGGGLLAFGTRKA